MTASPIDYGDVSSIAGTMPLIDKQDMFEKVRDRIAAILAAEIAIQQTKATAAGKDPEDWRIRTYSERANPWDNLRGSDQSPVANVWYSNGNFDPKKSNSSTRQLGVFRYNIDAYCTQVAEQTTAGHSAGEELAARKVHRAARILRNIIMHDSWTYLGYQGLVWKREIASIDVFQPLSEKRPVENVIGCRLGLDVTFDETTDLADENILEVINITFQYEPDGMVIAELQYGEES